MRKQLHQYHTYVALFAMLPLILISLTGSLLVFKFELDRWLMPETVTLASPNSAPPSADNQIVERRSLDELARLVTASYPDFHLGSWELFYDHHTADRVFLIKDGTFNWYKLHLDPYLGELLSEPVVYNRHYLTDWLLDLHYTLLLNDTGWLNDHTGVLLGLIYSLCLLFLAVSGLVMYRRFWARLFTVRWRAQLAVIFSDVHKMTGVLGSPILLILAFTGAYFNLVEFYHEEIDHADDKHHVITQPFYAPTLSIQSQWLDTHTHIKEFTPTYLLFPLEKGHPFSWFGQVPTNTPFTSEYASVVTFNAQTGEHTSSFDARTAPFSHLLTDSFRRLHFGNFAGLPIKIVWCLFGLTPVWLSISGFYLWMSRRKKRRKSKV